jgi:hypothetical protein
LRCGRHVAVRNQQKQPGAQLLASNHFRDSSRRLLPGKIARDPATPAGFRPI